MITNLLSKVIPYPHHMEQLSRSFSAMIFNPVGGVVSYAFPFIKTWAFDCHSLTPSDPIEKTTSLEPQRTRIITEIENLKKAAEIPFSINSYQISRYGFESCGGSLSLTTPCLMLPAHHVLQNPSNFWDAEKTYNENQFSPDEVRFLIARELGHIKKNDALIRIVVKIVVIATLLLLTTGIFYSFSPLFVISIAGLGLQGQLIIKYLIMVTALITHLLMERSYQADMDKIGEKILGQSLKDENRAHKAALSALRKMQQQNQNRPRWYLTREGNNRLDFSHPPLTYRIRSLEKHFKMRARLASLEELPS